MTLQFMTKCWTLCIKSYTEALADVLFSREDQTQGLMHGRHELYQLHAIPSART
jgi:hypothetical protein